MPERSCLDPTGVTRDWDNRNALSEGLPAKEALPAYGSVPVSPPDYASQRAPTVVETQPEMRWTGGPQTERQRLEQVARNNLRPGDYYRMDGEWHRVLGMRPLPDPERATVEEGPKLSKMALLELCVRIASWFAALGGFSSNIYTSVHVETLRTAAAFCQLAALLPLVVDSAKIFSLAMEKGLKEPSSGRLWYFDMLCMLGAGIGCSFLWRMGARDGVFEPFGQVNEVTIAIALMATNG